ncbi:DUF1616 domain-containing protein [Methanoculleus sp. FWC-SCC1]|uniref:DUF1616 domain-containing protein n=1 Tax=Methanoculleus frigidifontis TaxID=2584085 RepID=A0ABT8M8P2_9EURY|nr:DUF1616 domain-containing protein [Methanoculleus sp. FWC-SCC1]MDN7024308.1 DUF1616 domain-containing protein [Methanoculleus sp. FWC-SCC1]
MPPQAPADTLMHSLNPRAVPQDLAIIYAWIVLTILGIYLPVLNTSPLRVLFALPFILFIPGYLLIAALFPKKDDLDGIERTALSFGLSIAVVPLIGLALNYTPWGIRLDPIVASLLIFSAAMGLIAQYRRAAVPADDRFAVPFRAGYAAVKEEFFNESASRVDRVLSIVLLASILVAVTTTVYVIAVPKEGEKFTEFYILGSKGKAADYPTAFTAGTPQTVIIGIGNHEYRNVTYTVETLALNQVFDETTNESTILSSSLLDRYAVTVPHNETVEQPYTFTVDDPAVNRIEFLLFDSAAPDALGTEELINESYRDLHLWVTVRPTG